MSIVAWLLLGLVAGYVVSRVVNKTGAGLLRDIMLGIAGGLIGGSLFTTLGAAAVIRFNVWSLFAAVAGAGLALVLYHWAVARSRL